MLPIMPAPAPGVDTARKAAALELLAAHVDERARLDRVRAHLIRAARDAGHSVQDIAEALGVSTVTVWRYTNNPDAA